MEAVSPDIAKKLLTRDFTNLVARVQKGGKLTRAERAMLQSMATGTGAAPTTAASYVELAAILGITRQSINTWKKRKDAPQPAANGTHDVAAWREFMRRNDLKGGEPATQDAADLETSLKARKLLAEVEERELRLGIRRGDFVAVEEVRQIWTEFVAQATAMLRKKFEQELPPILSGLDATGIQEEARRAIDEVLTILHQGE
jgi:DNA-binding CsgD family transcriptional regulator